ncbi:hypothetical protein EVAR_33449_1 [Eumeta japonica]|uniref:Uncharacterized protein n=1 Tax=Eumeta variegata TaxID=151549 RepID=A0A4C1WHW4_EUMVA|nr:hypothetical protein EVAR_33449_1 [Eumeta japonica]
MPKFKPKEKLLDSLQKVPIVTEERSETRPTAGARSFVKWNPDRGRLSAARSNRSEIISTSCYAIWKFANDIDTTTIRWNLALFRSSSSASRTSPPSVLHYVYGKKLYVYIWMCVCELLKYVSYIQRTDLYRSELPANDIMRRRLRMLFMNNAIDRKKCERQRISAAVTVEGKFLKLLRTFPSGKSGRHNAEDGAGRVLLVANDDKKSASQPDPASPVLTDRL